MKNHCEGDNISKVVGQQNVKQKKKKKERKKKKKKKNFFFQAEDGIRDWSVTGVQTCALPISPEPDESDANGSQSPDTEDTKHLDEHGNRHPLLVMLESLEPLGPEDDFPEIYDPPVTVRNDNP